MLIGIAVAVLLSISFAVTIISPWQQASSQSSIASQSTKQMTSSDSQISIQSTSQFLTTNTSSSSSLLSTESNTTSSDGLNMSLSCYPGSLAVNSEAVCVAILSYPIDNPLPNGTVIFNANKTGIFSSTSCVLSPASSCSVFFTPEDVGTCLINAYYEGDSSYASSFATALMNVTK